MQRTADLVEHAGGLAAVHGGRHGKQRQRRRGLLIPAASLIWLQDAHRTEVLLQHPAHSGRARACSFPTQGHDSITATHGKELRTQNANVECTCMQQSHA